LNAAASAWCRVHSTGTLASHLLLIIITLVSLKHASLAILHLVWIQGHMHLLHLDIGTSYTFAFGFSIPTLGSAAEDICL
jgi:hypothetical protein